MRLAKDKTKRERKRLRQYNNTVAEIERIAHGGRAPVATAQTIVKARLSEPPLARIKRAGRLNVWELQAADEILHAYRTSIGAAACRDADLGIPKHFRPDSADGMSARRVDTLRIYNRWRHDLAGTPMLAAAVAVLLDDKAPRPLDRQNRLKDGATLENMIVALRHFAALRGNTPRAATGWKYELTKSAALSDAIRLGKLVARKVNI